MFGIGFTEFLAILLIVVIFLGADQLPQIGRSLGEAIKEFRALANRYNEKK